MRDWLVRVPLAVFVLYAAVFGGLYLMATHEWIPLKRGHPRRPANVEVTPTKPLQLEWPRRREAPSAPPLSLRIPLAAFGGHGKERVVVQRPADGGRERIQLSAMLPDTGPLAARSVAHWCEDGPKSAGCALASLLVRVNEDAPGREEPGARVMDSEVRGSRDLESSGPYAKLTAFWVKADRGTGRVEFVGWDCDAEAPTGTPTTDVSKPVTERNRCFEPASALERRAPGLAGYERLVELTACSGAGNECRVYFPYLGRYVEVIPRDTRITAQAEEKDRYLFLAAWELLNGLRADAFAPPSADVRLARGARALENCEALATFAARAADSSDSRTLDHHRRSQCALAAQLAMSALAERPAPAARLLVAALGSSGFTSDVNERRYLQSAIEALGKTGASAEMVQAKAALASRMPEGGMQSAQARAKRAAYAEALAAADAALPPGSDTHLAIYRGLARLLDSRPDADEKIALIERWQAAARQSGANRGAALREATFQLCATLEAAGRMEPLRACADDFLPLWLDEAAAEEDPILPYRSAEAGLSLMRWYTAYGLRQDRANEVLPTVLRLAALLQPRVSAAGWAGSGATWLRYLDARATSRPGKIH